jgi:Major Facilitator Superfamily
MTSASVTRAAPEAARNPDRRRWTALALLALAQLMLVLDVTVVNVALPDIGTSLHLTRAELPWVMTAYTVCFGGLMLLGGRLADRYGPLTARNTVALTAARRRRRAAPRPPPGQPSTPTGRDPSAPTGKRRRRPCGAAAPASPARAPPPRGPAR